MFIIGYLSILCCFDSFLISLLDNYNIIVILELGLLIAFLVQFENSCFMT